MKLLKSIFSLRKKKPQNMYGSVSDFFYHATREEKIQVFEEAARRANEEQHKIFTNAN